MCRVKPNVLEREKERQLQRIATRFVLYRTIQFLNFQTLTNFTVNTFKFITTYVVIPQNDANKIANSEDPDQTAPLSVC